MKSGIYCIENKINGMRYIGKGKNILSRMNHPHTNCRYISNAICKYGEDNFNRYVVEYCSIEELENRERYYIKEWNTKSPNGYNLTDGGEGMSNPSPETRRLLSVSRSGENCFWYGKHLPEEMRKSIGNSHKGMKASPYTKNILKEKSSGENNPMYGKTGDASPGFGKKASNAKLSKYYGVGKSSSKRKPIYWRARIKYLGKAITIGYFKTEIEAALAYDDYITANGIPHPLNFPQK